MSPNTKEYIINEYKKYLSHDSEANELLLKYLSAKDSFNKSNPESYMELIRCYSNLHQTVKLNYYAHNYGEDIFNHLLDILNKE